MRSSSLGKMICTTARAVDVVGDPWTLMILKELFMGGKKFEHFQSFTGISPHLLSIRVKKLEHAGVVARRPYQKRPIRYEYLLTEKGIDLFPVIIAFKNWSERWIDWPDGPPVELRHRHCDHPTSPRLVCSHCQEPITARDIDYSISSAMSDERDAMRRAFVERKIRHPK